MIIRRFLCTLLSLALLLSLSLPAALAVDNVPLGDEEDFEIVLPAGWVSMNDSLQNSNIMGFTPGAMYNYTGNGAARVFVLRFTGFSSPITLTQMTRYLADEGIAAQQTHLLDRDLLEAYVPSLHVYGIAFLDSAQTGYYIIGVLPGVNGSLDDQSPAVQEFFYNGIRFGGKTTDVPAPAAVPAPANPAPAASPDAGSLPQTVEELQAALDDVISRENDLLDFLDSLMTQYDETVSQLGELDDLERDIREALSEAQAKRECRNCGYVFPEGTNFKFCPECGTAR